MGTFVSPTVDDVSPVAGGSDPATRHAERLLKFCAPGPRGRHVIRTDGVYETKDSVTQADIAAADVIAWPDGTTGPAVFFGGHRTPVTASEGAALTAAGYTVEVD